jgi:hypothetical protein
MPIRPDRTHQTHDLPDRRIVELANAAITHDTDLLGRLHIPSGGLAVDPRPHRHRAQARAVQPRAQHLSNLFH